MKETSGRSCFSDTTSSAPLASVARVQPARAAPGCLPGGGILRAIERLLARRRQGAATRGKTTIVATAARTEALIVRPPLAAARFCVTLRLSLGFAA